MGRRSQDDTSVGEDSFLDTTANLVGILIILVVVVGAKTKIEAEEYGRELAEAETAPQLEQPAIEARALQVALAKQRTKLIEYERETEYRRIERDRLLEQVAMARESVQKRLEQVDEVKRQAIEETQEIEKRERRLADVQDALATQDQKKRPQIILEHLPTPMARTVFNREMHIQLKEGMVTVIPWDRLVTTLKKQAPLVIRRQASRDVLEDTLGPIGGFLMRFRMMAVPGGFELERFELETTDTVPRETLDKALSSSGRLRLELVRRNPKETVVTVWVFSDSFEQFRQLKQRLFDEGFLCAARPLPDGVRIGASPRGSRSSAQ